MVVEQAELWAAVLPVVELLDSIEVPYYIGGSVASAYTGIARATQDADLVAELRPGHAPLLIAALREQYYLSAERIRAAIRDQKSFNLIHLATAFKVDVFVSPGTAFARQAMGRRVSLEVPEVTGLSISVPLRTSFSTNSGGMRWEIGFPSGSGMTSRECCASGKVSIFPIYAAGLGNWVWRICFRGRLPRRTSSHDEHPGGE